MWKRLLDIYITQPRNKNKKKFNMYCYLLGLSLSITLLNINVLLYPAPKLSELNKAEGILVDVKDSTGGRYSSVRIIILTKNKKKVEIESSSTREEAEFYKNKIGKPIKVWYRWNIIQNYTRQVILDGKLFKKYYLENQLKAYGFVSIPFYIFKGLLIYYLAKPWILLIYRKCIKKNHKKIKDK